MLLYASGWERILGRALELEKVWLKVLCGEFYLGFFRFFISFSLILKLEGEVCRWALECCFFLSFLSISLSFFFKPFSQFDVLK